MPKIISYNVNGLRAAINKGWLDWLKASDPDIICLQEVKAHPEQINLKTFEDAGYHHYWHPAEKKGYSGVAILSKSKPDHVETGCGIPHFDCEGRILRADYGDVSVISLYIPSGSSGEIRQAFKITWLAEFAEYLNELRKSRPHLIICGDYNVCHKPMDIHNPKRNANTSGFRPEEREWMELFLNNGFTDGFRHFNQEPNNYTWWSYFANSRSKNLGWRIDYTLVTDNLKDRLKRAAILAEAKHSDHCPILLEVDF